MSNATGGWHPDPSGRHELRYWDGSAWTEHVSDGGVAGTDPVDGAPPAAAVQPFGTQPAGPQPYGAQPVVGQPYPGQPYPGQAYPGQAAGYGVVQATGAKPLTGLATALVVLLVISALASLLFAGALLSRASVLDDLLTSSPQELQDADDRVGGAVALLFLALLVTGILWMLWQFRHATNARLLGQPADQLGPPWAVVGWLIPLVNLVLPQIQLVQAAKASDPDQRGSTPPVLIVWWVLFAGGVLICAFSGRFFGDDLENVTEIDDFQSADRLAAFGSLVLAVAAIAGIVVVRTVSARQQQALRARGQLP